MAGDFLIKGNFPNSASVESSELAECKMLLDKALTERDEAMELAKSESSAHSYWENIAKDMLVAISNDENIAESFEPEQYVECVKEVICGYNNEVDDYGFSNGALMDDLAAKSAELDNVECSLFDTRSAVNNIVAQLAPNNFDIDMINNMSIDEVNMYAMRFINDIAHKIATLRKQVSRSDKRANKYKRYADRARYMLVCKLDGYDFNEYEIERWVKRYDEYVGGTLDAVGYIKNTLTKAFSEITGVYYSDKNRICTVYAQHTYCPHDENITIHATGWTKCLDEDCFSREYGINLATKRALKAITLAMESNEWYGALDSKNVEMRFYEWEKESAD